MNTRQQSPDWLGPAGDVATCALLTSGMGYAASAAMGSVFTGQVWGVVGFGAAVGAFGALANLKGCYPADPGYPPMPGDIVPGFCCQRCDPPGALIGYFENPGNQFQFTPMGECSQILRVYPRDLGNGEPIAVVEYLDGDRNKTEYESALLYDKAGFCIDPPTEGICIDNKPPERPPGSPIGPPIYYTPPNQEPDEPCVWTVEPIDAYLDSKGLPVIKYRSTANDPEKCGGPFEWWQGSDGRPIPINPDPPGPGPKPPEPTPTPTPTNPPGPTPEPTDGPSPDPDPPGGPRPTPEPPNPTPEPPVTPDPPTPPIPGDCCASTQQSLDAIKKTLAAIQSNVAAVQKELTDYKVSDTKELKFIASCDRDEKGKLLFTKYVNKGGKGVNQLLEAILLNQDKNIELLNQHLYWKTPTCRPDKVKPEGQVTTVLFQSTTRSKNGADYLRKKIRYFSVVNQPLDWFARKWGSFTWRSGPVVVAHQGTSVGRPQVWAQSEAEGKRVIRYLFQDEGVDPDKKGEWVVGTVKNPRYGEVKTMTAYRRGDYVWVTQRDTPDGKVKLASDL